MNRPKITKTWYEFTACWLEDTRELKQDSNYTQLALAMVQWDENRPQDEWEYYMVLADNLKTIIDAKFFTIFDGERYLASTDSLQGVFEAFQTHTLHTLYTALTEKEYTIWCEGKDWSDWFVELFLKPKVDADGWVITHPK